MVCDRCNCYFSFRATFCPFISLSALKIKISEKWKICLELSSFYTKVTKIMIMCYTVLDIRHMVDVIVAFHFGEFVSFHSPNSPKKWKFQKNEKTTRDIIILKNCTKNYDYRLCCPEMMCDGYNCFSFWAFFLPFYPTNNPKYENFNKNEKTPTDIILHMCTKNHDHMLYCSWEMARDTCNFHFSFWVLFCPFIPQQPKRSKFEKNEKNASRYHHVTHAYQKPQSYEAQFWRWHHFKLVQQKAIK